jgi:hypothetical protein
VLMESLRTLEFIWCFGDTCHKWFAHTNKSSHVCMGLATIEWKFIVTLVLKFLVLLLTRGTLELSLRGVWLGLVGLILTLAKLLIPQL